MWVVDCEGLHFPRASRLQQKLKTICDDAFEGCSKLEDVQLASSSGFFVAIPFNARDRLVEIAAAAGFPSKLAERKNSTLARPQCPIHPASPTRPNAARRGCWDCAPVAT